jgi:hypothetical protein
MPVKIPTRAPVLPLPLQRRANDEYRPVPYHPLTLRAISKVRAQSPKFASKMGISLGDYWAGRQGTAAALRAVDAEWGGGFYKVPEEALVDKAAADAALGGDQFIIDIQTHYIADRPDNEFWMDILLGNAESVSAPRFKGIDKMMHDQNKLGYSFAEYLRCVFLESETSMAVLTSAPGLELPGHKRMLNNDEMIGTRELIDRLDGTGRLINHSVVHPNNPVELEAMDRWSDWCEPAGWKVYTIYGALGHGGFESTLPAWMLDDEQSGLPFLDRVMETDVKTISIHKGLSTDEDIGWNGPSSPREIGPVAAAYPDINFIIFHSGYEPRRNGEEEGPYSEEVSTSGTNRLVKSLKDAGVGPGGNVYAELGSTWYMLMAHPRETAHVMGKLLSVLGEDNIVWGTDSIWYGPNQPLIDAFRAFEIPEEYCQKYGYPQLTATAKEKILGLNTARIYGIDVEKARASTKKDELAWVKGAIEDFQRNGTPTKR